MKALENLNKALQEAGGRRKAFKMRHITLNAKQTEILMDWPKHLNTGIVFKIEAFNIIRGKETVDAIKVIWRQTPTSGMMHYFTINEFNELIN